MGLTGAPSPSYFVALSQWLTTIVAGMRHSVYRSGFNYPVFMTLSVPIFGRVARLCRRFDALMVRLDAGLPAPARRQRILPAGVRVAPPAGVLRLPTGFAWLVRLMQGMAGHGSQLQAMLADPKMAALLAAEPSAGRILRPFCRMLGVVPEGLLATPRRQRKSRRRVPGGSAAIRRRSRKPDPLPQPSAMAQLVRAFALQTPGSTYVEGYGPEPPFTFSLGR